MSGPVTKTSRYPYPGFLKGAPRVEHRPDLLVADHHVEGIGILQPLLGGVVLQGVALVGPGEAGSLDPQREQEPACITPREIGSKSI